MLKIKIREKRVCYSKNSFYLLFLFIAFVIEKKRRRKKERKKRKEWNITIIPKILSANDTSTVERFVFRRSANLASVAISFSFVSIRTEIELLKKWMTARSRCFARKRLCGYDYQCTSVRYTTFPKPCVHTALCSEFPIFTRQNIQYFAQLCATPQENLNNPICLFRYCLYMYIHVHCRVRWFFPECL